MHELGHTPWGQRWLGALHAVDRENRLGRGLELARQGAVEDIVFGEPGVINARVRGSRSAPYRVTLSLRPFDRTQITALVTEVARRPDWLDLLLVGRLPPGIEQALAEVRVRLFPKTWRELGMACTCPDDAVPCKHIAASLYRLAQYIDEDPLLLFAVRGLDLANRVGALAGDTGLRPTVLRELTVPSAKPIGAQPPPVRDHRDPTIGADFTGRWARLLPSNPPFYPAGDFAELYLGYLRTASRFWGSPTDDPDEDGSSKVPSFELPFFPWEVRDLRLTLDAGGGFLAAEVKADADRTLHEFTREVALVSWLDTLDERALPRAAQSVRIARLAYRLSRQFAVRSAVLPRLLDLGDERYRVRWEAAVQDPDVAAAVLELAGGLPPTLLRYRHAPLAEESDSDYRARLGREIGAEMNGEVTLDPPPAEPEYTFPVEHDAVHALLGVFLRPLLLAGVDAVFAKAEHAAVQLLFLGRPVSLANTGDAQLALGLQLWLRRLHLDQPDFGLLIQVSEREGTLGAYGIRLLLVPEHAGLREPLPLADAAAGQLGEVFRLQTLRDVSLLAEAYAPFAAFAKTDPPESITLYGDDFAGFLFNVAPALRLLGAQLLLPHGLDRVARPKLSAAVEAVAGQTQRDKPRGLLGLNALVEFDWQVAVGEQRLSADEFEALASSYEGIVRLRDGFVWLEAAQTARLLQRLADPPRPSAAVVLQSVLTETFRGASLFLSEEARRFRENLLRVPAASAGNFDRLRAVLRPYQEVGFSWLLRNAEAGLGSLLADDMGLGKTLQTIALLEHFRATDNRWRNAPALLVLPTSLLTNWRREIERFAPELSVVTYHGPDRKLAQTRRADVVLTTYGVVRQDERKLAKPDLWGAIVIDEAQQIKNPDASQTKAVKALTAPLRIALSGTPVENRLSEYWCVLDFANPGYLGPLEQFKALYADPIERDRDPERLEVFRQVTAPFILRRLKTDRSVISDLPDKITQVEFCSLEPEQAGLYQQVVDTQLRELAAAEPSMRRGRMLKFMTAVKQVCNHPRHYLKRGSGAASASGKALRTLELVELAVVNGERVLIFTQYRQMGELLAGIINDHFGWRPPFLHGGLTREERDGMVAGMQEGSAPPVLLLSLKAGGTGLNLTAANHVIHYDLWWNPAVESQATDRAFRIGQSRNVHVHRLITAGTFEERIDAMLARKRELADLTAGAGGAWLGDLAEELLLEGPAEPRP